ncbi:MAG: glycosyltransferase family 39 protein [Acidobacteria bacterium]|nr:glycosyltransferase family 39 protein [Acidobacteriota bacterium]
MIEPTSHKPQGSAVRESADESADPLKLSPSRAPFYKREGFVVAVFTFLLTTIVFIPILKNGFPSGVDSDRHFQWITQFSEALKEPGVWYPRWLGSANNQLGSPVMLYYPPLSFYVAALFERLTGDAQKALVWSCFAALMLSGLTLYRLSREFFSPPLSLFAAALYMLAPYHLLDLYHGGAVPEFWSFVWLPLVLHAVQQVAVKPNRKTILYLAISYTLLLLTHIPISFVLSLVLPIYILLLTRRFTALWKIAAGLVLGLSLSAFFLLPVVFEREAVRMNALLRLEYDQYFVLQRTRLARKIPLFTDDLAYYEGHAGDLKAPSFRYLIKNEQAALGLPLLVVIGALLLFVNRKYWREHLAQKRFVIAIWIITALTLLMASKSSLFIWKGFSLLTFLQFPWRWLALTTVGGSLVSAAVLAMSLRAKRWRILYASLLALVVFVNLTLSFFLVLRAPFEDGDFNTTLKRREAPEYRTIWWDSQLHEDEELPPYQIKSGEAEVQVSDGAGSHQTYVMTARSASVVDINALYFPGWAVRVDGRPTAIAPSAEGYIEFNVEIGEHRVTADFEDTRPRLVGKIISILSLLLVAVWSFFAYRKKA